MMEHDIRRHILSFRAPRGPHKRSSCCVIEDRIRLVGNILRTGPDICQPAPTQEQLPETDQGSLSGTLPKLVRTTLLAIHPPPDPSRRYVLHTTEVLSSNPTMRWSIKASHITRPAFLRQEQQQASHAQKPTNLPVTPDITTSACGVGAYKYGVTWRSIRSRG